MLPKGQSMKAYITGNVAYQDEHAVSYVESIVKACPFKRTYGRGKYEAEYRQQIRQFIWHIIHSTLYSRKEGVDLADKRVPISSKLGQKKLPMVFGHTNSKRKIVSQEFYDSLEYNMEYNVRSLDWLIAKGIVKATGYCDGKNGKKAFSRKYKITKKAMRKIYPYNPQTSEEIFSTLRLYNPLKPLAEQQDRKLSIRKLIEQGNQKEFKPEPVDMKVLSRTAARKERAYINKVLAQRSPMRICINAAVKELGQYSRNRTLKGRLRYQKALGSLTMILKRPMRILEGTSLELEYWPKYKVAAVGTRLYEQGGFQTMPVEMKQACARGGTNVDMAEAQLTIIRNMLKTDGIDLPLKTNFKNEAAEYFGISPALAKQGLYATMFNLDNASKSRKSVFFKDIKKHFLKKGRGAEAQYDAELFINEWNEYMGQFIEAMKYQCNSFISVKRKLRNKEQYTVKNAVGAPYEFSLNKKGEVSPEQRRKIMAHMVQGKETKILFESILSDPEVRIGSFEHDGAYQMAGTNLTHPEVTYKVKAFYEPETNKTKIEITKTIMVETTVQSKPRTRFISSQRLSASKAAARLQGTLQTGRNLRTQ